MKKLLLATLASILIFLLLPIGVYATTDVDVVDYIVDSIAAPDTIQVDQVNVYRNALEENDQLYVVTYVVNYAAPPAEGHVDALFIGRLLTNAGLELGSVQPYSFFSGAWGSGVFTIYFSAADAPAWNPVPTYNMRLEGNPSLSWDAGDPPQVNHSPFVAWYDDGSIFGTSQALASRLRAIATVLESEYAPYDLIATSAAGRVLTTDGEDYFTSAIPNLRTMCPQLFSSTMVTPDFPDMPTIDDFYAADDNSDLDTFGVNWYAQSFNASSSYGINGAWLKLYRVGTPGTVTMSLRATDAAGLPTGADLLSGAYDGNSLNASAEGSWYHLTFTNDYLISTSTNYTIVLRATAGGAANYVAWMSDVDGIYGRGFSCNSSDSGATWAAQPARDNMFIITATDSYSLSYRQRCAQRLIGTPLDMTGLGALFGLSRMWVSTILFIAACIMIVVYVGIQAESYKPTTFAFALLLPFGGIAGFIYLEISILVAMFFTAWGVYSVFYR